MGRGERCGELPEHVEHVRATRSRGVRVDREHMERT